MNLECKAQPLVGVGLRHKHYQDALASPADIDFVEVHSENFFAAGGATIAYLQAVCEQYKVSLHSTALGLGSAQGIPPHFIQKLKHLVSWTNPILISDHASYAWGTWIAKPVHLGDLLPLSFNQATLEILAENVNKVQQTLQRKILIENLSSYLFFEEDDMTEAEFLAELTHMTGCGLLLDINNILVSAFNTNVEDKWHFARNWLASIPETAVGEIHLAGHSKVASGELVIDDHSKPVDDDCWQLYRMAIQRFGAVPTLIEWDNDLPDWQTLVDEANKAKVIASAINQPVKDNSYE